MHSAVGTAHVYKQIAFVVPFGRSLQDNKATGLKETPFTWRFFQARQLCW